VCLVVIFYNAKHVNLIIAYQFRNEKENVTASLYSVNNTHLNVVNDHVVGVSIMSRFSFHLSLCRVNEKRHSYSS
jgi:hypothetical protein